MPKIQEYQTRTNAPDVVQTRRYTAAETDISRGVGMLGQGLMAVSDMMQKRQEQDDLSLAGAKMAEIQARRAQEQQQLIKEAGDDVDPNEVIEKFNTDYDTEIEELQGKMKSRAGQLQVTNQSAQLKTHLRESTISGLAVKKGEITKTRLMSAAEQRSAAVLNDPSSLDITLKMQMDDIDAQVKSGIVDSNLGQQMKAQVGREITVSAVRGWAELDPEGTIKELKAGKFDSQLDGNSKRQLLGEAEQEIRNRRTDAEIARSQQERIKREQQGKIKDTFIEKYVAGSLTSREISASGLDPDEKRAFINWNESRVESGPPKTNAGTFTSLLERIHLDDGDPNKITDEKMLLGFVGKGIGFEALNQLRGEMMGRGTAEGKELADMWKGVDRFVKGRTTKSMMGMPDPDGDKQHMAAMIAMRTEFKEQRKNGKTPRQLLSPTSPDYIGNMVDTYTRTPKEIMDATMARFNRVPSQPNMSFNEVAPTGTPPPSNKIVRQPGESAKAFLDRQKAAKR